MSALPPLGYQKAEGVDKIILDSLKAQGRYAASEPNLFTLYFAAAKAFKQAIGALYKQKIINIDPEGIQLIDKD